MNDFVGNILQHRCMSRQIFGGVKDFCPNFPKLARKNSKENDLEKRTATIFSIFAFFKIKAHCKHYFFPNFPQTCPKTAN